MSRLDYSKWDHIEVSDDEDDQHPNIDTASLNKWRHEARVERMKEAEKEKQAFDKQKQDHQQAMAAKKKALKEAEEKKKKESQEQNMADSLSRLKMEVADLEKQERDFKKKEDDLKKKERLTPWNVDTICHDAKEKTIINTYKKPEEKPKSEEEKMDAYDTFVKKNKKEIQKFGMMKRYEDSQQYLSDNLHLACEDAANYLAIWCIDLEVEEKHELMSHVAHQTIVMQFILELARTLDTAPQACVRAFFSRIKLAEKQYMDAFNDELDSFKERVKGRAQARIQKAMEEYEEEERQKRLGPGGLDPMEVYESLPKILQDCFDSQDIPMLQKAVTEMPKEEAEYHIKRCIDSGLWVPGGGEQEPQKEDTEKESASSSAASSKKEEPTYSSIADVD